MSFSPILILHICAGALSVLSGTAAISFRKGSDRHAKAGNVFVVSMLILGTTGAYIGFTKHQTLNGVMGILTCYLMATAWRAARRSDGKTGIFDLAALVLVLSLGAGLLAYGLQAAKTETGMLEEYPTAAYFVFGSVALLFAAGDVRMLVRGSLTGVHRIARHLTRMCFGFFIAAASFFLGRQRLFPEAARNSGVLYLLSFMPLILMVFWLIRVRFTKKGRALFRQQSLPA